MYPMRAARNAGPFFPERMIALFDKQIIYYDGIVFPTLSFLTARSAPSIKSDRE